MHGSKYLGAIKATSFVKTKVRKAASSIFPVCAEK